ncbi:MAG: hypothetical protein PVF27_07570 [Gemmatimonadales bacterium]|jgi:hypothetical protein
MSRRIRLFVVAFVTALALGSTACASVAGPSYGDCTGTQSSETCPGS